MQTRSSPNIELLHRLAELDSIPNYQTMPKDTLYAILSRNGNMSRLMRMEARTPKTQRKSITELRKEYSKRAQRSSTKVVKSAKSDSLGKNKVVEEQLNTYDPIMLTEIGKAPVFLFVRPNGTKVRFCVESLVDYLLSSGDFTDPETRIPFSEANLLEIDTIAKNNGFNKPSVAEAKKNCHRYSDSKFRRDALLAIERCAGEVVTDILTVMETHDPEDAQMMLFTTEFPLYADYFRQMQDADRSYAAKCSAHWKLFLKGPPNRPNKDNHGLLRAALQFLKQCDDGNYS